MKKFIPLLLFGFFFGGIAKAQVTVTTGMYTDYQGFWSSSSTNINPVWPEDHHLLLGFTWGGITYSTGIDNDVLDANSVAYTPAKFRALPIVSVPTSGGDEYFFVGFGQLSDGIDTGTDDSASSPFGANPTSSELAVFLTDGKRGMDISTCIANIPISSDIEFVLSENGITKDAIGDGVPDILATQVANPEGTIDEIRFVDSAGNTVGTPIILDFSDAADFPVVGKWRGDFYTLQSKGSLVNVEKEYRFYGAELSDFGINDTNYQDAASLVFTFGGSSDTAFLAYNEPSIGVASTIGIITANIGTDCDGNLDPITVEVQDNFEGQVKQAGFVITATLTSGPGQLLGDRTKTTDSNGQAIFNDLAFEVGGNHKITFSTSSLKPAVTLLLEPNTNCNPSGTIVWDGSTGTDWSDPTNWTTEIVPNANFDVVIPSGVPNYPILDVDTGAKNLSMDTGASIDLNGHLFTIAGQITVAGGTPYITGDTAGSELYMFGTSAQTVPENFLSGDFDKFTVDNDAGVLMKSTLAITGVLNVKAGTLTTNGKITMACNFVGQTPLGNGFTGGVSQGTGQIAPLIGNISGDISVEQCFPARRAYRFVTSSVTTDPTTSIRDSWQEGAASYTDNPNPGYGTHITGIGKATDESDDGSNGFDYNPSGNASMYLFDNSTSSWDSIPNTTTNLVAGTPYRLMIRGDRSIDITDNETPPTDTKLSATGTIVKGPVTQNNFNSTAGSYNFFGNPFHAAVNMKELLIHARNVNSNYYFIWDPTLGGNPANTGLRGAYVAIDLSVGGLGTTTIIGGASGATEANIYLQPMQAALFATGNEGTTPQLVFKESYKHVGTEQTATFRPAGNTLVLRNAYLKLNLFIRSAYASGSTASDGLKIKFKKWGDNDLTMKDAWKFRNPDENLARMHEDAYLSIEQRSFPVDGEVLPLFLNQYRYTEYTFLAELHDLPENVSVYIYDAYLDVRTELTHNSLTPVNFDIKRDVPESIAIDRFSLVFNVNDLSVEPVRNTKGISIYPNPSTNGNFFVSMPEIAGEEVQISLYNILGQEVYRSTGTMGDNNRMSIKANSLSAGIYIVKLAQNGKVFNGKLIIE